MQHMSRTALDLEQRRSPTVRLGGSGTAHEIAAAAALLLSDDASYITRRVLEWLADGVRASSAVMVSSSAHRSPCATRKSLFDIADDYARGECAEPSRILVWV